jgi:hypothetical protein
MARRSLHVIIKVFYRSMSCFAMVFWTNGSACNAKVSRKNNPSCTMWLRQITKYVTKYDANPHSTEQDTQPIVSLISKQVVPHRTCGGTCCPGVSTPKIRPLADSSTTQHDGINHLHHSNHCPKPQHRSSHGQLASRRMGNHNTLTKTQVILNITKDGRLVWHSWLQG